MCADFPTLPDEHQELANELLRELKSRGYKVVIEPTALELPATPTIRAKRNHETHYFLVRKRIHTVELEQWHRYCCSCNADTRATIVLDDRSDLKSYSAKALREKGVGLGFFENGSFVVEPEARDLAFHAKPPDRKSLSPRARALLGESLDRLERGDWRAAFEEACGVFEEQCRSYLVRAAKLGRANYQSGSRLKTPTERQIAKMTMGALKDVFCSLVAQNQLEAQICSALTTLNPDRVDRTHKRLSPGTEARLRRRVGQHFWLIANTLSRF